MANSNNGEKKFYLRIIAVSLTIILLLIGSVWALTWHEAEKKIIEVKELSIKACEENDAQNITIKELESNYEHILEKLNAIHRELQKQK